MQFDLFPNSAPFHLQLGFNVSGTAFVHIEVFDPSTLRHYAERRIRLKRPTEVRLKFPIAPECLRVRIQSPKAINFELKRIGVLQDTKCPLSLSDADKDFIGFAKWFAVEVDRLSAGEKGTLYQSNGFTILYLDTIKDGGMELTTPARIARASGVIELSKKAIAHYTVPMLIVMLLHEYAHTFKNPLYGKAVENELTADLIAVHIALNLGFDPFEVENCFLAVFATKDTDLNRRRMGAIREFISLFLKNEKGRCKLRSHAY